MIIYAHCTCYLALLRALHALLSPQELEIHAKRVDGIDLSLGLDQAKKAYRCGRDTSQKSNYISFSFSHNIMTMIYYEYSKFV